MGDNLHIAYVNARLSADLHKVQILYRQAAIYAVCYMLCGICYSYTQILARLIIFEGIKSMKGLIANYGTYSRG